MTFTELTPAQAHTILFGNYVCGNELIEPPIIRPGAAQGGRKSTRIHTRNSSRHRLRHRHRRHAQRGGALGTYSRAWAEAAEQLMKTNYSQASATLRFYRLIIFVDLIHLLELDKQQLKGLNDRCKKLVDLICTHLNDERLLTAYFKSKFGSMQNVIWGAAGLVYEVHRQGIFSYFTQALSYISTSETVATLYSYAVTIVDKTMEIWGLGWSLSGIVNWALLLYGIKQLFSKLPGEKQQSVIQRIFNFAIGSFITAKDGFIAFPGMVGTVLTKAKEYYSRGARNVATGAKNSACSAVVNRLVDSKITPEMLLQLGTTFETIISDFDPSRVNELKCMLMSRITDPVLIADLNELANPDSRCAAMSGAALGNPAQGAAAAAFSPATGQQSPTLFRSPAPGPALGTDQWRTHPDRLAMMIRATPYGNRPEPGKSRNESRVSGNTKRGGSSKHKKKHPRSTNKRKRLGRRRTKNKGKW